MLIQNIFSEYSVKKSFLEISQNVQKNTCARVSFLMKLQTSPCRFIKKETLAQVFSCEFCEISKNTFLQSTYGQLFLCMKEIHLQRKNLILQ